jgi:hypothetical protein
VCAFGLSRRLRVHGPEIGMGRYKFNSIGISGVKRAAESAGLQNRTWRYKQGRACSKEYNVHAITDAGRRQALISLIETIMQSV